MFPGSKKTSDKRKHLGKLGEDIAVSYLINNGYRILERNLRTRSGEADIIAEKNNIIFFIEVKTRKQVEFRDGYSEKQRNRLREIANHYLTDLGIEKQVSFAVMGITGDPERKLVKIEFLEDNFDT